MRGWNYEHDLDNARFVGGDMKKKKWVRTIRRILIVTGLVAVYLWWARYELGVALRTFPFGTRN